MWQLAELSPTADRHSRYVVFQMAEVAVPHAFCKLVVRESPGSSEPDVLAFLYPHHHLYKQAGPHDHLPYLASVAHIEELTGLDFLTALPVHVENALEQTTATSLW